MTTNEATVSTREGMDNGHNGQQKIYEMLTEEIVSIIEEKKELPWRSDFTGFSMPKNLKSGKEYSGTNRLLLMLAQTLMGYSSPY
jgi:antirestriction protein ArdC